MNKLNYVFIGVLTTQLAFGQLPSPTAQDKEALQRTTKAIRDAFARGDVDAIVALHHPDVIKY